MDLRKDPVARAAARLKPLVRHAIDRVAQPYVDQAVDRMARIEAAQTLPAHFHSLAETLHEARTLALADVPKGASVMLSAGASGAWYFDWVDESYGRVTRHIGVEAFSPEPQGLPAHVEWVAADIAGPRGIPAVPDHSVDLLFSGQNVEHLWPSQMVAFFVEANRVLADGGLLVVDSPNRAITAAYGWSMGEHTVEMTPTEARALAEAAGFAVEAMKGVWLCRIDGELLGLEPDLAAGGPRGLVRRFALAAARPDDSFIWWAQARRVRAPDRDLLADLVHRLFESHWPERVSRLGVHGARTRTDARGRRWAEVEAGTPRTVLEGPSMPLPAGAYTAAVSLEWEAPRSPGAVLARLEVRAGDGTVVGAAAQSATGATADAGRIECPFDLDALDFGVTVALTTTGAAALRVPVELTVGPEPWRGR